VPECFKDDNASQWKSGKFDPRSLRNPWTDRQQNLHGWLRRGPLPLCKISSRYDYLPPFAPQICENAHQVTRLVFFCSSDSLQPRPLHRFSRLIRQMTRFRARVCLLGSRKQNFTFRPHFSPKTANFSTIFDGTLKISRQKGLNNARIGARNCSQC